MDNVKIEKIFRFDKLGKFPPNCLIALLPSARKSNGFVPRSRSPALESICRTEEYPSYLHRYDDEKWLGYGLYRKPKWIATKCAQKNQKTKFINELEKVI